MPSVRFNCEPSKTEEGARFRATTEAGLVVLRAERRPSTVVLLTMTKGQATVFADLLRREANAAPPDTDRRPRLAL
jgi:hypothetical protein